MNPYGGMPQRFPSAIGWNTSKDKGLSDENNAVTKTYVGLVDLD